MKKIQTFKLSYFSQNIAYRVPLLCGYLILQLLIQQLVVLQVSCSYIRNLHITLIVIFNNVWKKYSCWTVLWQIIAYIEYPVSLHRNWFQLRVENLIIDTVSIKDFSQINYFIAITFIWAHVPETWWHVWLMHFELHCCEQFIP